MDEVIRIENLSFDNPYPYEVFEDYLGSDLFLVYEVKGEGHEKEIVGYVIGKEEEDFGIIISLAVTPSYRSQGIGTLLMRAVLDTINRDHLFLTLRPSNKGTVNFYKKFDFVKIGKIKDYYRNGEDAIVMEKRVDDKR